MPLLDHFGWISRHYDRLASAPDTVAWVERLNLPVDGYLLDVGGGTGRISAPLRSYTKGVVIADPSLGMGRQSAAKPGLRAVCGEAERLPFPDNSFERILMVDAFHHVRDHSEAVADMVRVLKPGGRLLIADPDLSFFGVKLIALFEKILLMRSHLFSPGRAARFFSGQPVRVQMTGEDAMYYLAADKL